MQVEWCSRAEEARTALAAQAYDLMVLDLRLPGQDGLDFLADLRAAGTLLPVLILTARDSIEERVKGLDGGGDDYLTKPFAFAELLARINALLRRKRGAMATSMQVGELTLDTIKRQAARGKRTLNLSPKEFMVLEFLMRHNGEVVTRDMIGQAVWQEDYNALTNLVEVFINRLRQKIDLINEPQSLIATIRGSGYRLRSD